MARSVVETGSAFAAMDAHAKAATEAALGPLPFVPRMRVTATLRELRALMQVRRRALSAAGLEALRAAPLAGPPSHAHAEGEARFSARRPL